MRDHPLVPFQLDSPNGSGAADADRRRHGGSGGMERIVGTALVQLTLARMREFYREPEAIFWVFGFPIVLAFALGIAFRNRGPGELRVAVLRGAGDSVVAAALARAPGLTAAVLDSAEARLQLRTGRVALLGVPGDPVVYRYEDRKSVVEGKGVGLEG